MRLWSLHPRYLDRSGLTAVWREALLARAVLAGRTVGYRFHPQLARFRQHPRPIAAIEAYLAGVRVEAQERGYRFRALSTLAAATVAPLAVTTGQVRYELALLLHKLERRAPQRADWVRALGCIQLHPMLRVIEGPVETWERVDEEILERSRGLAVEICDTTAAGPPFAPPLDPARGKFGAASPPT